MLRCTCNDILSTLRGEKKCLKKKVGLVRPCSFHEGPAFSHFLLHYRPLVVHVDDDQSIETIRFFRVEQTYAVTTGKWYFEFEALSGGDMRVGWARPGCRPDVELGVDDQGFVFDGYRVKKTKNKTLDTSVLTNFLPSL